MIVSTHCKINPSFLYSLYLTSKLSSVTQSPPSQKTTHSHSKSFRAVSMVGREVKGVFLGDSGTGKTSIIAMRINGFAQPSTAPTLAGQYVRIILRWQDLEARFAIWDTAGQEVYRSITPMYYRDAAWAVVVYDVTHRGTFEKVQDWISELKEAVKNIVIIICGNKRDCELERCVTFAEGSELATKLNTGFIETSAKTGEGIDDLFELVVTQLGDVNSDLIRMCQVIPGETEEKPLKLGCC
jgi:small GTP-binding protein